MVRCSVLVVDDDPQARELVTAILRPEGYRVIQAGAGERGLALVQTHSPAVVVLDWLLPDLSGAALLARLRADAATRAAAALMLTAHELSGDERARLETEGVALVDKNTFSRDRLLGELARLRRAGQSQAAAGTISLIGRPRAARRGPD